MTDYDANEFRTSGADVAYSWVFAAIAVLALALVVLPFLYE